MAQPNHKMILNKQQIQSVIDDLERDAQKYELEFVAKKYAMNQDRKTEGVHANHKAKILRNNIQELSALLYQ